MIRFLTYCFAGIVLGGIIHLSVTLIMPTVSSNTAWQHVTSRHPLNRVFVVDANEKDLPQLLNLDPAFAHAICPIDLFDGPVSLSGQLPQGFWTASLIAKDGGVPYSTTSRTNSNSNFDVAIFTPTQSQGLAAGEYELAPGMTIVKSEVSELIAIVRALPTHRAQLPAYLSQLSELECGFIE